MLEGVRVRDLQRLAPDVLAGVLPRLYPQMLELAYDHQDAGRPIFICTAASQEMAELMAIVLDFDGAVGSVAEVVDGALHRAAPAARSPTARARRRRSASWPSARRSTSPRRGPTRTRSPTCRCCGSSAIRSPSTPIPSWPRRARGGLGGAALRAPGRRLRVLGAAGVAAALGGLGSSCSRAAPRRRARRARVDPAAAPMSLHELTHEQREIRDLARASPTSGSRRAPPRGTATTPSRASSSASSASSA